MSVLTIKITQFENNIGHKPTIDFSYQIIDKMIKTKITEMDKSETFARVINLLYVFYPNKTFKISKPMRVEFFLDEGPIGTYLPKRCKKDLNKKFKNNFQFKVKESTYVLIEYIDNHKSKKIIDDFKVRDDKKSYLSLNNLFNSIEFRDQKLPKYWSVEISTPMYN